MKKKAILLAGLISLAASSAWALPSELTLTLQSGTSSVVITDNSAGDYDTRLDSIRYWGNVGSDWEINVSTGRLGSTVGPGVPQMVITSDQTYNGIGSSSLTMILGGITGLWSGPGAVATVSGNTNIAASSTFVTQADSGVLSTLSFSGIRGEFGDHDTIFYSPEYDELVEMVASITQSSFGSSGYTYMLTPIPEPANLMLLGCGFLIFAIYSKRRMNA